MIHICFNCGAKEPPFLFPSFRKASPSSSLFEHLRKSLGEGTRSIETIWGPEQVTA